MIFDPALSLSGLDGSNGFVINGVAEGDGSGTSVDNLGDINGDGIDDFIIGALFADPNGGSSGQSYVVFGRRDGFGDSFDLSSLNGSNGFVINGIGVGNLSGRSVSEAGDVNGDGINDLIIGADSADPNGNDSGESYVVFGRRDGFEASLELSDLNGNNGFSISGVNAGDFSGRSVSQAGDVNGDGIDDLIIGAYLADSGDRGSNGVSYVVFGRRDGFEANLDLANLDGTNGFAIHGIETADFSGRVVSQAGDINGDGLDDLIIGAPFADSNATNSGESYVVFGHRESFGTDLELSDLDGRNGFVIEGDRRGDYSGSSASYAGDINGDGIDDLIVGASAADPNGSSSGKSYVVFGRRGGFEDSLELSSLDGSNGFVINGIGAQHFSGNAISGAGDINGDGIDDLIIGAPLADPNGQDSGESYVVFGRNGGFDASLELSSLDGNNGFMISGIDISDHSGVAVSGAGDVNGDGVDDLIIGADGADPNGHDSGESYVVFGRVATPQVNGLDATIFVAGNGNLIGTATDAGEAYNGQLFSNTDGTDSPDDVVVGTSGDDIIWGGSEGNDVVFGGSGNDIISFGEANFLVESTSDDSNAGNTGEASGSSNDTRDPLTGLSSGDMQSGSTDARSTSTTQISNSDNVDVAFGQGGNDTFVLQTGDGFIQVGDFTQGEDVLEVHGITFEDLSFVSTPSGSSTFIYKSGDRLAELQGFTGTLTESDFSFL
ncbi:MAG: integrin alpha [Cyanobacteria bacterium J06638_20]